MSNEEVIIHTFNILRDKYKELVIAIRACDSLISFEKII